MYWVYLQMFFLISTCECDGNCHSEPEDCFSEFQALSPPPAYLSFFLLIPFFGFFFNNFVKYK